MGVDLSFDATNTIFGDGSDLAGTFDGTSSPFGIAPSGSVYTLTKNLYATTITINASITVKTAGYRIFCTTSLVLNGTLTCAGNPGTNAGSGNPGNGGLGLSITKEFAGSGAGTSGGGGMPPANGYDGAFAMGWVTGGGGAGGAGGGASPTWPPAPGGLNKRGVRTLPSIGPGNAIGQGAGDGFSPFIYATGLLCGGGAGGGGGGRAQASGGCGGGGGSGGGVVVVYASAITMGASSLISAAGGNGGAGESSTYAGGGGGGGSGGLVFLYYRSTSSSIDPSKITVAGGTGGSGGTGANPGVSGGAGSLGVIARFCADRGIFE